jgi:3'-5' exoribonuclease
VERTELSKLKPGQTGDFFALLCEKTKRSTKDGKPYFAMKFRDRLRTVSAPVWENAPYFGQCEGWSVGMMFKIRGSYQEHKQFGPQVEISNIRPATPEDESEGFDPDSFVARTKFDVDELWQDLMDYVESLEDVGLRELVRHILCSHEAIIRLQPAASRNHHAYRGGYLEHTVSVVRTGIYLAEKYREYYSELSPAINRDLVVAGCILHDIGKMKELALGADQADYTVEGMLIGHIVIGRDMVREAAREVGNVDAELLLYLEHIILSHQGTPEWGSPKVPMMPEAFLVHHADDIDAKMNMFVDSLSRHEGEEVFTNWNPALARRILAKREV